MWMKGMSLKKAAQVIWVKTNIGEIWDTRTTIILSCQQSLTLMATILTTCKFHGQRNQQRDQSHTQNLQRGHIQKHQRGHIAKLQRNLTRLLSPELKNQEKPPGSQLRPLKRWQHSSPVTATDTHTTRHRLTVRKVLLKWRRFVEIRRPRVLTEEEATQTKFLEKWRTKVWRYLMNYKFHN